MIRLRDLLRDIDTAARLGEGRFGVMLEGVARRERASEFATRLVAAGLREDDGESWPLRFHAVGVVLAEYSAPAETLLREMAACLSQMSPRSRRPIRFLTGAEVAPSGPPSDGAIDTAAPTLA